MLAAFDRNGCDETYGDGEVYAVAGDLESCGQGALAEELRDRAAMREDVCAEL